MGTWRCRGRRRGCPESLSPDPDQHEAKRLFGPAQAPSCFSLGVNGLMKLGSLGSLGLSGGGLSRLPSGGGSFGLPRLSQELARPGDPGRRLRAAQAPSAAQRWTVRARLGGVMFLLEDCGIWRALLQRTPPLCLTCARLLYFGKDSMRVLACWSLVR